MARAFDITENDVTFIVSGMLSMQSAEFEERRQHEGESFDDFFVTFKSCPTTESYAAVACTPDITRITPCVADRWKLLTIDQSPSQPKALWLCRSEESLKNTKTDSWESGQ